MSIKEILKHKNGSHFIALCYKVAEETKKQKRNQKYSK